MLTALNKHPSVNRRSLYSVAKNMGHPKLYCCRCFGKPKLVLTFFEIKFCYPNKPNFCKDVALRCSCLVKAKAVYLQEFWVIFVLNRYNQVFMYWHEALLGCKRLPVHSFKKYPHYSEGCKYSFNTTYM